MSKFSIDLSKFKKIKVDGKATTLRHPAGHEIKIAHGSLGPDMKAKLDALPHFVDGGGVDTNSPQYKFSHSKNFVNNQSSKPSTSSSNEEQAKADAIRNADKQIATSDYAQGGQVQGRANYADSDAPVSQDDVVPVQTTAQPSLLGKATNFLKGVGQEVSGGFQGTNQALSSAASQVGDALSNSRSMSMMGMPAKSPITAIEQKAVADSTPSPQDQASMSPASPGGDVIPSNQPQSKPDDVTGFGAMSDAMNSGVRQAKQGNKDFAAAVGAEGEAEAAKIQNNAEAQANLMSKSQQRIDDINHEHDMFMKEIQDQKIDPNNYLGHRDTGQKIATGIGLLLSGMGSGITGGPNGALDFINKQIDRDIDAQKANLGKKETLLSANMKHYGNEIDGQNMTRVSMNNLLSMQLQKAAAMAKGPQAAAQAMRANGELEMQNSNLIGQTAARQTVMNQINTGQANPYTVVETFAKPEEKEGLRKELASAQDMVKAKDNVLSAWNQIAQMQTIPNRAMNPVQSTSQINALMQPIVAELSKATAGKFTDSDAHMLSTLFPTLSDNDQSRKVKINAINKLISTKMNFDALRRYGINPEAAGRFGQQGQSNSKIDSLRSK